LGYGITDATRRRLRRLAVWVAAPTLMLGAVTAAGPARAAAASPAATGAKAAAVSVGVEDASATAGATWSRVMRRKLDLETATAKLATQLPTLRAGVTTRNADLLRSRAAQKAGDAAVTAATTADGTARDRHSAAKEAAAEAKKAVTEAQRGRPRNKARIANAKEALTAANATVRTRADAVARTASALTAARAAYASATSAVTRATAASQAAVKAVADAEAAILALPQRRSDLAAQAAAVSQQVVTQTRASFTTEQTTKVYGITVNKIVAYPFQRMIDDAAKAGIKLSGGGFRTRQQQIALRIANGCPDIYTAPASSCRVPTAIPGRSLHEIGLAVDITSGGKTITDRKGAPFKWLVANAARYGFVNLPAEAWHWSITGN
jgi:D-alanyl-D-alanine carboxypeptidase